MAVRVIMDTKQKPRGAEAPQGFYMMLYQYNTTLAITWPLAVVT